MNSIAETKRLIEKDTDNWLIPFMEFVDDFRHCRRLDPLKKPFKMDNNRLDGILASTAEYLCRECNLKTPDWIWNIPDCKEPWFVSGVENLKATAIVESPVYFRRRKIFVLENFLQRV